MGRLMGLLVDMPQCRPLAHVLVHSVRCVSSRATDDSAKEAVAMVMMASNPSNDCAFDAAFGDGSAWGKRNR
jgi:hypothetical protein